MSIFCIGSFTGNLKKIKPSNATTHTASTQAIDFAKLLGWSLVGVFGLGLSWRLTVVDCDTAASPSRLTPLLTKPVAKSSSTCCSSWPYSSKCWMPANWYCNLAGISAGSRYTGNSALFCSDASITSFTTFRESVELLESITTITRQSAIACTICSDHRSAAWIFPSSTHTEMPLPRNDSTTGITRSRSRLE